MKNHVMAEYRSISEVKQALYYEFKTLKKSDKLEAETVIATLQKIDNLWSHLVSNVDSIAGFYVLDSHEQKIRNEGYFNNINDELRLSYSGDQDQQSLQECCSSLNRCLDSLTFCLDTLNVLLNRSRNPEDESDLLGSRAPRTARSHSVSDLLEGCSDRAHVPVTSRTGRAFSEPLLDLSDLYSKKFSYDNYCYSFFSGMRLASAHISKLNDQLGMSLLLLVLKRFTKFLYDMVDIFEKIVIQRTSKESKSYFPAWFLSDSQGRSCLCKAQELKNMLQTVTRQAAFFRDNQGAILVHAQRQAAAESQAVMLLVDTLMYNGQAKYVYGDNVIEQVRYKNPVSQQEKEFCEKIFGKEVFEDVKQFIFNLIVEGDRKSKLAIEFKSNKIEIRLERSDLVIVKKPLSDRAQKFLASFNVVNFSDKASVSATLPMFKPLPELPKSRLAQFLKRRNKPRTLSNPEATATQQVQAVTKTMTL